MRRLLAYHKWFGLVAAVSIVLVALTGMALLHADTLGLGAIRLPMPGHASARVDAWDVLALPQGGALLASREGLFRLPSGERVLAAPTRRLLAVGGELLAGTRDGLYTSPDGGVSWRLELAEGEVRALAALEMGPVAATHGGVFRRESAPGAMAARWQRVVSFASPLDVRQIVAAPGGLLLAAKEGMFRVDGGAELVAVAGFESVARGVDLKKLVTDLHTGAIFGRWFVVVADASALGMMVLAVTGVWIWWYPRHRRRLRVREPAVAGQGAGARSPVATPAPGGEPPRGVVVGSAAVSTIRRHDPRPATSP